MMQATTDKAPGKAPQFMGAAITDLVWQLHKHHDGCRGKVQPDCGGCDGQEGHTYAGVHAEVVHSITPLQGRGRNGTRQHIRAHVTVAQTVSATLSAMSFLEASERNRYRLQVGNRVT
jgi:hypothetical protein